MQQQNSEVAGCILPGCWSFVKWQGLVEANSSLKP